MTGRHKAWFWACVALQAVVVAVMIGRKQLIVLYGRPIVLESQPVDPHSLFQGDYARLRFAIHSVSAPDWQPWPPKKGDVLFTELAPAGTSWALTAVHRTLPSGLSHDNVVIRGHVISSRLSSGQPIHDLIEVSTPGWIERQPSDAQWRRTWTPFGSREGVWHEGGSFGEGAIVYVHLTSHDGEHWDRSEIALSSVPASRRVSPSRVTLVGRAGRRESVQKVEAEYGIESFYVPEGTGRRYERAGLQVELSVDSKGSAVIKNVRL